METFTTKIARVDLLRKITANRDNHLEQYQEATKKFKEQYIERLLVLIDRVKNGSDPDLYIKLSRPECHIDDYNSIVSMLEMSSGTEIEISFRDFERYVLDKWEWKNSFDESTSAYLRR